MCRIAISALDLLAKRCFSPDEPFPRLPVSFLQRACSEGGVGDLVAKNILLVHPLTLVCIVWSCLPPETIFVWSCLPTENLILGHDCLW